jgi:hypothetical protein
MSEQIFLGGPAMGLTSPKNVTKTIDWIKSWDKHDWLNFVEITTALLSAIPQPAAPITSPILLGISTTAGVANAVEYFKEGDKYTGGLILAFSVIPAGQLISTLKGSKTYMGLGTAKSIKLINAAKSGTATSSELKIAQELVREIGPHADELAKQTMTYTIKKTLQELPKMSLNFILKLCIGMVKLGVFGIKEGIVIAGTFFTYDKIYKALNYKNKKNLSIREKNGLVKTHNILWGNKEEIKKQLIEEIKSIEPQLQKNQQKFFSIDTTYEIKF